MNPTRWIALHCGDETESLQAKHPNAFLLLCQIARRAKWKDCAITKLKEGEAFIGDWKQAGLPSEKAYRVAKTVLTNCGLVAFRGASKGTVATLVSSMIFTLNADERGGQKGEQRADTGTGKGRTKGQPKGEQRASIQTDTIQTDQNKQSSEGTPSELDFTPLPEPTPDLPGIVAAYPRRENGREALLHLEASLRRGEDIGAVLSGTRAIAAVISQLPSGPLNSFVPSAARFFKDERWKDDPKTWIRTGGRSGDTNKTLDLGGRRAAAVITC